MTRVYKLIDPRDGKVKYIGCTTQPLDQRVVHHFGKANLKTQSACAKWLQELVCANLRPIAEIIFEGPHAQAVKKEIVLIKKYRKNLVNTYLGGGTGKRSAEACRRMTLSRLGKPQPGKWKAVIRNDGANFQAVNEAAKKTGIKRRCISNSLTGYTKSAGGFSWRYKDVTHSV